MNKTLVVSEDSGDFFPEEVEFRSLTDFTIDTKEGVKVGEKRLEQWDNIYIDVNLKGFSFLRVLAENMQRMEINSNLNPTLILTAKKPYLFQMLADKQLSIPKTVTVSSQKGVNNLDKEFEGKVIARRYSNLELEEREILEPDELGEFADSLDHFEDFIVYQMAPQTDYFEVLYIDGDTISLKISEDEGSEYQVISDEQKELVERLSERLGIEVFQTRIGGGKIMDVKPDMDLELFMQESGKNTFDKLVSGLGDKE